MSSSASLHCPVEISHQLSNLLHAVYECEYTEVEWLPWVCCSDNVENPVVWEDTLVLQGAKLLDIYAEGLQLFNKFRRHLMNVSFVGDSKLWDSLSRFLLFIQPSHSTCWNFRKFLVQHHHASYLMELKVSEIALKRDAKASEAWHHRKWLLSQHAQVLSRDDLLVRELELCRLLGNRFEKCYHLWYYRWWLVQRYLEMLPNDLLSQEYETTSKEAIRQHVTDHGTYFYRQKLLLYLLKQAKEKDRCYQLLRSEWTWIQSIAKMVDHSFDSFISYARFIYCCCDGWLDKSNIHQQSLIDDIYKTLQWHTVENRRETCITLLSKMSQQLVQQHTAI